MSTRVARIGLLLLFALGLLTGCVRVPVARGTFEKTLSVTGPLNLETNNGSGDVRISTGPPGQVHIRGEFEVHASPWESSSRAAEEFKNSPPIEQQGNFVRIGRERNQWRNVTVSYTIVVPAETELRASTGSGDLVVRGVRGLTRLRTGSGDTVAEDLGSDTEARAGSGDIQLTGVDGRADVETGSGDMVLDRVRGEIRVQTGSGNIRIMRAGGGVRAHTGSGDIEVRDAHGDLTIHTGSGNLEVEGNPPARAFWDLSTSSGEVQLDVPRDASFLFEAHTRADRLHCDLPIEITERSKREVRGRVGKGEARVVVETTSGNVIVR